MEWKNTSSGFLKKDLVYIANHICAYAKTNGISVEIDDLISSFVIDQQSQSSSSVLINRDKQAHI